MYTILMNTDKSLNVSVKTTIYQREKLVDKFRFLIPPTYDSVDLSDFTVILKYLDQGNEAHSEVLVKEDELYKEHLSYILPVDTNLTRFAGDITLHLTISKVDMEEKKQYSLETGEVTITISPLSDYYHFVSDSFLDAVSQKISELDVRLEAMDKIAETYDQSKADDLSYENNTLQLLANGKKIGSPQKLDDEIPAVDIDESSDSNNGDFEVVLF